MTARAFEFTLLQLQPRRNDAGPAAKQWKESVQRWTWWMDHEPDCFVKSCQITMTSKQHVWVCVILHTLRALLCDLWKSKPFLWSWKELCRTMSKSSQAADLWQPMILHIPSPHIWTADLGKPKTSPPSWYHLIIAWSRRIAWGHR